MGGYRQDDEGWITINGTHVKVNESGELQGSVGQKIASYSKKGGATKATGRTIRKGLEEDYKKAKKDFERSKTAENPNAKNYKNQYCKNSIVSEPTYSQNMSKAIKENDKRTFRSYASGCEGGTVIQGKDGSWAECVGGHRFSFYKNKDSKPVSANEGNLFQLMKNSGGVTCYTPKSWYMDPDELDFYFEK